MIIKPTRTLGFLSYAFLGFYAPDLLAQNRVRVPQDVGDLQGAINRVADGGVIEVAAGTYVPGANGFVINGANARKSFTVRAVGGPAVLDGQGNRTVLRYESGSRTGKKVTFEGLTFRNGASTAEGRGGALNLQAVEALFANCVVENSTATGPSTGGGAARITANADVTFRSSTVRGNSSGNRGGAVELVNAALAVEGGIWSNNRVNLPGHLNRSSGGAVFAQDSRVQIDNARFEGNQAGYAGGAIYLYGNWRQDGQPSSQLDVSRSTFTGNRLAPVTAPPAQTSGGAIHLEDQTSGRIVRSLFVKNEAEFGGAVDGYRAVLEVQSSAFRGNHAPSGSAFTTAGGAVLMGSPDFADSSTGFGAIDRRPSQLTVSDTLFQGRFEEIGVTADNGGCLYVDGDTQRLYGASGVPQSGSPADNRARVVIRSSVFADCDAEPVGGGQGGLGGGFFADLVDLTLETSLFFGCDARGATGEQGSGGALFLRRESAARISRTTFADNSAVRAGGAISLNGSTMEVRSSNFLANEVSPGVSESLQESRGSSIFSTTQPNPPRGVGGVVADSLFSGDLGLPIREIEQGGAGNDLRYDNNRFFARSFGDRVYANNTDARDGVNVAGLNRLPGKVAIPNTALSSAPPAGTLVAAPAGTAGATGAALSAQLGYAWSGSRADVNGQALPARTGLLPVSALGDYRLTVDGAAVATARIAPASCTAGPLLCVADNRFRITVQWKNGTQTGNGEAVALTRDTGYFWFFNSANVELIVKIVDGRALNGRFWVFFGALTNLQYTLKVTDQVTGQVRTYNNPAGRIASVADTNAFSSSASASSVELETTAAERVVEDLPFETEPRISGCVPGPTTLCLSNGRVRVTLTWKTAAAAGAGQAVTLTSDTGYFWFFDPNNVEVVTKIIDGRGLNGHFWVFYGALSNVEYTLTATDTQTGRSRSYTNPAGRLESRADTTALPAN